jgi:hypothetical protein
MHALNQCWIHACIWYIILIQLISILNTVVLNTFYFLFTTDIDECAKTTHDCDNNANCINTEGSFKCTCQIGYKGNGTTCNGEGIFLSIRTVADLYFPCICLNMHILMNYVACLFSSIYLSENILIHFAYILPCRRLGTNSVRFCWVKHIFVRLVRAKWDFIARRFLSLNITFKL